MKKIIIVFILLGIYCCKKKKDDTAEQPAPVMPTPLKTSAMTANINGAAWVVTGNQTSGANISQSVYNGNPKQYVIGGRTNESLNKNSVHLGFSYTTGTVNLVAFTNFYALYIDSTGTSFPVNSGTINITAIDTSHAKSFACDKFKATFSFVTSKVAGISYTVNQGSVDFEAN